jgi:hypothetical protein
MISLEALAIIVGFVGVVTVPFILYFLNKKRDDENRRREQTDKKIAEAKELLNIYNQVTREILTIRVSFNATIPLIEHNLSSSRIDESKGNFKRIEELLNISPERVKSISGLKDDKLIKLHEMLRKEIYTERGKLDTLKTKLNRKESINMKKDILETTVLADSFGSIISTMYERIEKIANTEP